jgi:hypothetical protein
MVVVAHCMVNFVVMWPISHLCMKKIFWWHFAISCKTLQVTNLSYVFYFLWFIHNVFELFEQRWMTICMQVAKLSSYSSIMFLLPIFLRPFRLLSVRYTRFLSNAFLLCWHRHIRHYVKNFNYFMGLEIFRSI